MTDNYYHKLLQKHKSNGPGTKARTSTANTFIVIRNDTERNLH